MASKAVSARGRHFTRIYASFWEVIFAPFFGAKSVRALKQHFVLVSPSYPRLQRTAAARIL